MSQNLYQKPVAACRKQGQRYISTDCALFHVSFSRISFCLLSKSFFYCFPEIQLLPNQRLIKETVLLNCVPNSSSKLWFRPGRLGCCDSRCSYFVSFFCVVFIFGSNIKRCVTYVCGMWRLFPVEFCLDQWDKL